MDITTWKKKINDYTSVKEALDDLRLIWTNCCTFNAEGSEINNTALRIGVETEAHIEESDLRDMHLCVALSLLNCIVSCSRSSEKQKWTFIGERCSKD